MDCAQFLCTADTGLFAADAGAPPCPVVSTDLIRARPVVCAFFQRSILQLNPSSAVVSVQSYSQSSAASILAANV